MAKNILTPEQDLLTRHFFVIVGERIEALLPNSPASGRTLRGILLQLLNYDQLPSGAFVTAGTPITRSLGDNTYSSYPSECEDDYQRALEELDNEGGQNTDSSEASSSVEAEDTEVR